MSNVVNTSNLPSQKDAIAAAIALYPKRPFAVSDVASQSGWLKAAGHDPRNLYVSGPMGLATSVAQPSLLKIVSSKYAFASPA